jgi:hypothetical protein
MKLLAAAPGAGPGTTEQAGVAVDTADAATMAANAKTLLNADDLQTALATAAAAVAAGGGADAFAARAEAKRALGRPLAEVIDDYAQAARLDPRYAEKYQGVIAQLQSEAFPVKSKNGAQTGAGGVRIAFVGALAAIGLLLLAISILYVRRKKTVGKSASEL